MRDRQILIGLVFYPTSDGLPYQKEKMRYRLHVYSRYPLGPVHAIDRLWIGSVRVSAEVQFPLRKRRQKLDPEYGPFPFQHPGQASEVTFPMAEET